MAMHNINRILKLVAIPFIILLFIIIIISAFNYRAPAKIINEANSIHNTAAGDSAAESLNTLTAELSKTKKIITDVSKSNEQLKQQNNILLNQMNSTSDNSLKDEIKNLKDQMQTLMQRPLSSEATHHAIEKISTLSQPLYLNPHKETESQIIPFYTIPANGTSVRDKLMTALVGRIPVKGVVTDPYPFKIVMSDDNLAANGLRIPHLSQMIVSGYCEGDLNLGSVRGWVTSLTFVFEDGTISTTTSNDNNIGNFTKENSLGYLSDEYGNPFIRGKIITNAPAYLAGNTAISATTAAANAYAEMQKTNSHSLFGTDTNVTGSALKFIGGQATASAANDAQQWWHDREEQSFDAVYVPPIDAHGKPIKIAVNFAKEIHIDYDPNGRKLNYEKTHQSIDHADLD